MRGFWFVAGAAAGVYATNRMRRAAEELSVDGIHDRLTGWFAGARVLRGEVALGMAEKEAELRERLDRAEPQGADPQRDNVRQLHRLPAGHETTGRGEH
jgi:hypothetical protein